jgi:hypothetical protein
MATRGEEASPDPHGATTAEVLTAHLVELGPCLVGATGGSGTRVFARIVRRAGLFIGTNLNVSEDAVDLGAYSDRWINTFMDWRAPGRGRRRGLLVRARCGSCISVNQLLTPPEIPLTGPLSALYLGGRAARARRQEPRADAWGGRRDCREGALCLLCSFKRV